jgi:hypothetical protein
VSLEAWITGRLAQTSSGDISYDVLYVLCAPAYPIRMRPVDRRYRRTKSEGRGTEVASDWCAGGC